MSEKNNDPRGNFRQANQIAPTEKKVPSESEKIEAARDALDKTASRNIFKRDEQPEDSRKTKGL